MTDDQNLNTTVTDEVAEDNTDTTEPQAEEVVEETQETPTEVTEAEEVVAEDQPETVEESSESVEETPADSVIPSEVEESQDLENKDTEPRDPSVAPQDDNDEESGNEQPAAAPQNDNPNARWYVVHTYSGHENKVATTLKQKVETERLEDKILDVLVPVQDKIEIKNGKKATIKEKIFPGYILVKMVLEDNSWLAVRTTQGVTSFVGIGNKPTPISEKEVQTIVAFTQTTEPVYKQVFTVNDTVKIVEGPFAEFIGKIDSVDEEKGKVRVLVSIFGRETPVELDFLQVQKI